MERTITNQSTSTLGGQPIDNLREPGFEVSEVGESTSRSRSGVNKILPNCSQLRCGVHVVRTVADPCAAVGPDCHSSDVTEYPNSRDRSVHGNVVLSG